ncbi:MAG: hypothetical protein RLZZ66_1318 [Pseudomonadota bacterium]|jgi:hypothetical protein
MKQLSPTGQQIINNIAQRYAFSSDAVFSMLVSVINGNGSMAQFNHPEFGGSGQWMRGGMIMVGDMFNNGLKNSVGNLCQELANLIANEPNLIQTGSFQSQNQDNQEHANDANNSPQQNSSNSGNAVSLFMPGEDSQNWWISSGLQFPNSIGKQNNIRYAYFASIRRLAIQLHGDITLYDTLDHQIGGFSQQQGNEASLTFTSQYGLVDIKTLPIVSVNNDDLQRLNSQQIVAPITIDSPKSTFQETDIFSAIEKLAILKDKAILTENEFSTKKAELLARL